MVTKYVGYGCEIRFKVDCFVSKTLPKRMAGICVSCCGWAMLSDNDVWNMTSSLTPTSALSVKQPSLKGEDVCEIRSSLFCAPQRNHYSNDTVSIILGCPFQIAAIGKKSFIVSLFFFLFVIYVCTFIHCFTSRLFSRQNGARMLRIRVCFRICRSFDSRQYP